MLVGVVAYSAVQRMHRAARRLEGADLLVVLAKKEEEKDKEPNGSPSLKRDKEPEEEDRGQG